MENKIYLTNLGKYNEGELVGKWLDLPFTEEEYENTLKEIGINEEYEEMFITDYENEYDITNSECSNIEELNALFERIDNLYDYEKETLKAVLEVEGVNYLDDINDIIDDLDNYTFYENRTLLDVAYKLADEQMACSGLQDNWVSRYFDYEAFARDLSFEGYKETSYGVLVRY